MLQTFKDLIFWADQTVFPSPQHSDCVSASDPEQKTDILMKFFEGKHSGRVLTLPFICYLEPTFRGISSRYRLSCLLYCTVCTCADSGGNSLYFFDFSLKPVS